MNRVRPVLRTLPVVATVLGFLLASGAFAQGGNAGAGTCQNLKQTQYWRVSFQIAPMPNPVPNQTRSALDGFQLTTRKNSGGTITVDIERTGRSDNETNETADQDDIKVDTSKQILYFLEGQMGDDAVGIDTHLNDEAVVLTDLNGCILQ